MRWDAQTYGLLHAAVFRSDYAGYRPTVREIPNGDGVVDAGKRFAHVAPKYNINQYGLLQQVYSAAFSEAWNMAQELGVPAEFAPHPDYSCLRVLEYPPGTDGAEHTDFDLFTLNLWRNQPECVVADPHYKNVHGGELAELLGLGKATKHSVLASATPQYSIVFFAIPDHAAVLPNATCSDAGVTVGEWLTERIARSRVY